MDLKAARKQKGWRRFDLEERTGVAAHNVSALETGGRIMGKRLANKLAGHLDASSTELMVGNRAAAMKRAIKENDALAVLTCAKAIVEAVRDQELTGEDREFLDRLVNDSLAFAETVGAKANEGEKDPETGTLALAP